MRFDRLGTDAGLSEQAVHVIAQDPAGFLWIGTEDGLDRYDGYGFKHFTHDRSDPGSVANNFISDIQFDAAGGLLAATDGGGIARRDPVHGRFTALGAASSGNTPDWMERVRVLHVDRRGRTWIGTRDAGLAMVESASPDVRRFRHSQTDRASLADNSVLAIIEDRRGRLWIGTDAGVDVLDPATSTIEHHRLSDTADAAHGRVRVRGLVEDFQGSIWIGTDSGLERFDPATGVTTAFRPDSSDPHALPAAAIEVLYEDREQRLWIGTTDGLVRFDREQRVFETYRNDPRDHASLPDNDIVSLLEDRGGLLWVGTKFGGLAQWNPRSWSFGHRAAGTEEGFANHNIMSFTEDRDGRLWVGTFGGGLTALAPGGVGRALTLRAGDSQGEGLGDDRVMALLTDHEGSVWAGTMGGGLDRIAPHTHAVTHYRHNPVDPGSLGAAGVMTLLQDAKDRLWVGTYGGGLSRLDHGATAFVTYAPDPGNPVRLASGRVTALAADSRGRIWSGTDGGGLSVLDPASGRFTTLRHTLGDPRSLGADTVYALYIDSQDTVWIGTRGGGLDRATAAAGGSGIQLTNVSKANGLPNDTIYGILPDAAGRLWLSTNHGLACFDPLTGAVRSYYRSHGLQADEFNFGAHYRARDGRLLFGGANGYNAFHPERLQGGAAAPQVALTAILKGGLPMRADAVYDRLRDLHLGYRDDVITFEFAALDFATPAANAFRYQLEGFDKSWIEAGARRSATYTHLPSGRYTLRVAAANADGVWNPKGLALTLEVAPPPWKSWWAYTIYAALGALLLSALLLRQRRAQTRAAHYRRRLEREVADRTSELAERNGALEQAYTKLETVSFTDALTGLANRRALDHAMPTLISDLERERGRGTDVAHLALLLVDLDRLKPINDQLGHEAGDRLLIEVASILQKCTRTTDKVVRWGGDEFVIVHAVSDLEGAAKLAERIRYTVSKRKFKVAGPIDGRTSCSIGFALYPFTKHECTRSGWEKALSVADANLYRAKVTRNAWLGCSGKHKAAGMTDLESLARSDLETAERNGLVEVRRSLPAIGETIELLLRRPAPGASG